MQRLRLVIVVNVIGAFTGLFWFVALFMAVSMRTRDPDPMLPHGRVSRPLIPGLGAVPEPGRRGGFEQQLRRTSQW